jgi:hypothetical protein
VGSLDLAEIRFCDRNRDSDRGGFGIGNWKVPRNLTVSFKRFDTNLKSLENAGYFKLKGFENG